MVNYTYLLFKCPACGNVLKTPETFSNTRGCCPFCERIVSVPEDKERLQKIILKNKN